VDDERGRRDIRQEQGTEKQSTGRERGRQEEEEEIEKREREKEKKRECS